MKSFIVRLLLFASPLALLASIVIGILYVSGEFYDVEEIMERVRIDDRPTLVGRAYVPFDVDFKESMYATVMPEITALGNSRVLEIRQEFFAPNAIFYNRGLSGNVYAWRPWLDRVPTSTQPSLVFVAIEQSLFNADSRVSTADIFAEEGIRKVGYLGVFDTVAKDILLRRYKLRAVFAPKSSCYDAVGVDALVFNEGFRNDGSHYYGKVIADPQNPDLEDYQFRDTFRRIDKGINLFIRGQDVSEESIVELELFLQEATHRGIHIVAFTPPYAPTVYRRMAATESDYSYITVLEERLRGLFKDGPHQFFGFSDVTDVTQIGADDSEFIDGVHGSERVYGRMMQYMAEHDPVVAHYVDSDSLSKALASEISPLELFPCSQ